jgi:Hydrazine synthase alpha subunit middle domain
MMRKLLILTIAVGTGTAGISGCDNGSQNVLGGIPSMAYLSRGAAETGNVFDYEVGGQSDNLFTLTPPTATGQKVNITQWTGASINSYDLSFDAREFVISAKAPKDSNYHLYRVGVDGSNPCDAAAGKVSMGLCQITDGPYDQVYPIYVPGGTIFYVTNQNVEGSEVPQFRDEYERATTAQAATCQLDGSNVQMGPRNVSHRVSPTLLSDGRVLLTEWRHLGDTNEGDLTILNQDMTNTREGFGRESKGITNSYLRAKEVSPGMIVAIGTSRDRTFQSGKIVLINLGGQTVESQSEARSSVQDLTLLVPGDRTPSFKGVGRYYDVTPVGELAKNQFLVSWSDGAVEEETNSMAKDPPDFGIYVFNATSNTLTPVVNEIGTWETTPMAIVKRAEPTALGSSFNAQGTNNTLLGAINVYNSTMFPNLTPGSVKKVRITEGFSTEEGFPNMFGLSDFDGQSRLGEFDLNGDNSFKAVIPANTPVRIQLIDKYGMAVPTDGPGGSNASEPIWIQGRAGEARECGGCHEDRTSTITIPPGASTLQAAGAAALDYPGLTRQQRMSTEYTQDKVMGVPWNLAIQPIFDAGCVDCHDGTPGPANPSYTITDLTDMTMFSHTFDLTSKPETINAGDMVYTYSASYISLLGPSMAFEEKAITVTGDLAVYITPGNASQSDVIKRINPPARYPSVDLTDRAFAGMPVHPAEVGVYNGHDGADPKYQLTADQYFLLELSADNGGQYYSRENAPGAGAY